MTTCWRSPTSSTALPLAEFTPARDSQAKELKGDDLGKPVKALKKPSLAAWVVNLLVRREQTRSTRCSTSGPRCGRRRRRCRATSCGR